MGLFNQTIADRCRLLMYDHLVDNYRDGNGVHRAGIKPDFKPLLEPYFGTPYPLSRVGILPRVTRKYMGNWINVMALTDYFYKVDRVGPLLQESTNSFWSAKELVKDVLSWIGTESYTDEWTKKSASMQLEDILEESIGVPEAANRILAQELEAKITGHFRSGKRRRLRILDLGVGVGNTIAPVIELMGDLADGGHIPHDFMKYVQVFLVDVSRRALNLTMARLTTHLPGLPELSYSTPVGNIVMLPSNFAELNMNATLNAYRGKMDLVISGASICHQTDLMPFFSFVRDLLAPDGEFHAWDWYNGPSWAAPRLRLSRDDRRRNVFYVQDRDGRLHPPIYVDDEGSLTGRERKDFCGLARDAQGISVVYEMTEDDAAVVLANFRTLLRVLGYVGKDKDGMKVSRLVDGEDIDLYLRSMFDQYVEKEHGFSYIEDFLGKVIPRLDDPGPLKEESAYYLIEGYGDDYGRVMRRAGFGFSDDENFLEVYRRHKGKGASKEPMTHMVPVYQIRYTTGTR